MLSLNEDNVLELTGILGLHKIEEKNKIFTYEFFSPEGIKITPTNFAAYKKIIVIIKSPFIFEMIRLVDFENRYIKNLRFISQKIKFGIAEPCIKSQVHYGILYNFNKIDITAARSYTEVDINGFKFFYNGYKKWGKYGFYMSETSDQIDFSNLMSKNSLAIKEFTSLYKKPKNIKSRLLAHSGKTIWDDKGFTWQGRFILKASSNCFAILHQI